ncbi:MAG: hypothetical protein EYC69_08520 [Bacteroidetes bacterium]|nr:MAG: hypothetical protein EYC69_08520 [Bacteroidota bacterium]
MILRFVRSSGIGKFAEIYLKRYSIDEHRNVKTNMAIHEKFEPEDYYLSPEGYIIFTEKYHLKRGYCCQSGCKHCPWNFNKPKKKKDSQ